MEMSMLFLSIYTAAWVQPVSAVIQISSACILAVLLALRMPKSISRKSFSPAKFTIVLLLLNSFVFVYLTSLLSLGIGTSHSFQTCLASSWITLLLYSSGKYITTLFLLERYYLIAGQTRSRIRSPVYLTCGIVFLLGWIGLFIFTAFYEPFINEKGACTFHLPLAAPIISIILEFASNVTLSALFIKPLLVNSLSVAVRKVAIKSIWASVIAMISSLTNLIFFTVLWKAELSTEAFVLCSLDSLILCTTIFFVTTNDSNTNVPETRSDERSTRFEFNREFRRDVEDSNSPFENVQDIKLEKVFISSD